MKDYELDNSKKGLFILNYKEKGNKIIVNYANGDSIAIENTGENIRILDKSMKEQVENSDTYLKKCKKDLILHRIISGLVFILTGIYMGGFATFGLVSKFVLLSSIALITFNVSEAISLKNKIKDVKKNKKFLEIESTLNEKVTDNENMLYNTNKVTRNIVRNNKENDIVFTINNIDRVPFSDLEQIMFNIEREDKFNFEYPEVVEDKAKKKTK